MPRHCSAGGCKSRDNRETRNAGITFHKLPKGATRRNLWITNSHRADFWDPQTDFVYFCSKHFTPESFELTGCSGIRRLKEDAFPTVFESSLTTKTKRAGTKRKRKDVFVRKGSCSSERGTPRQETEEFTVEKQVEEDKESHENLPVSSQESPGVKPLPQQESPPPDSRPLSPSRYMRRLPPPPGFYLAKDHSYAQLCPLLWRRRYDQAIDCLEKALRQLHAARRRENRLRSTVMRLRDKRLKHTLLVSGNGGSNRESWTPGGHKGGGREGVDPEDNGADVAFEHAGLFGSCLEHMDSDDHSLPHSKSWSEEERGCCFYCGRGQVQPGAEAAPTLSKKGNNIPPTDHKDTLKSQGVEARTCGTANSISNTQTVRLGKNVEANNADDAQNAWPLPFNAVEGESELAGDEHRLDLQKQERFWIHGTAEGHVILVPVLAEDGLQSFSKMEEDGVRVQTILVSEEDLKRELEHMRENSGDLTAAEAAIDEGHSDSTSTVAGRREDVREKLKEHLEGFHLQLSTEFLN